MLKRIETSFDLPLPKVRLIHTDEPIKPYFVSAKPIKLIMTKGIDSINNIINREKYATHTIRQRTSKYKECFVKILDIGFLLRFLKFK